MKILGKLLIAMIIIIYILFSSILILYPYWINITTIMQYIYYNNPNYIYWLRMLNIIILCIIIFINTKYGKNI